MISDLRRDEIQAAAYRRLFEGFVMEDRNDFGGLSPFQWECRISKVRMETTALLASHDFDVQSVLDRLSRDRMTRLPDTQFVYWPNRQSPRMVHAGGQEEFVREQALHLRLQPGSHIYDLLADHERTLFSTDDRLIVWWRGDQLWNVYTSPSDDHLMFTLQYGLVHIWDNDVHHESRADTPPLTLRADPRAFKNQFTSYRRD